MKTYRIFGALSLATVVLMMGACGNDDFLNDGTENEVRGERVQMTFSAAMPQTRTVLAGGVKVAWQADDAISVLSLDGSGESTLGNDRFFTKDNAFSATFTGLVPEDAKGYIAVYPYQEGISGNCVNGLVTLKGLSLGSEQQAVAGTFNPAYNISAAYAPQGTTTFAFQNLCTLVKFRMVSSYLGGLKKIVLKAEDEGDVLAAESFSTQFHPGSSQEFIVPDNGFESPSSSVTLNAPEDGFVANTDYYFAVLPLSKENVKISLTFLTASGGEILKKTSSKAQFQSNTILNLGEIVVGELPEGNIENTTLCAAAKAVNGDIQLNDDGTLTLNEENWGQIKKIEELDLSQKGLTDISDIKYFTNLKRLNCSNNNLTDELYIPELTKLEELDCSGNQLTDLNTYGLCNLRILRCDGNQFSSLSLYNLYSLEEVYCSGNGTEEKGALSSLYLGDLPSLKILNCSNNVLNYVSGIEDMSGLEQLDFSNNALSSLDVSKLSNLKKLFCSDNKDMYYLSISGLSGLEQLKCNNNNALYSLDVSSLSELQVLECYNNGLGELSIVNNKALTQLLCGMQKTGTLKLKLTEDQKGEWERSWSHLDNNNNVDLYTPEGQPYNQ